LAYAFSLRLELRRGDDLRVLRVERRGELRRAMSGLLSYEEKKSRKKYTSISFYIDLIEVIHEHTGRGVLGSVNERLCV